MITQEEYDIYIESIEDKDVPFVVFNTLLLVKNELKKENLENLSCYLFEIFFKQYNTVLTLSNGLKHVYDHTAPIDLDLKSIYTLTRSAHELYLSYNYLFDSQVFTDFKIDTEEEFKLLSYKLSGEIEQKKTIKKIKENHSDYALHESALSRVTSEITKLSEAIKENEIYKKLPKTIKDNIRNGIWKVNMNEKLSWSKLLEYSIMSNKYGAFEYNNMSKYAHSAYSSLQLEASHDHNKDGYLLHLHFLASLFSHSILKINNLDMDILPKKEQSLLIQLIKMVENYTD